MAEGLKQLLVDAGESTIRLGSIRNIAYRKLATPNYPMYTSLLSITEPHHHYLSISSVLRRTSTIINNA